MIFVTGATGVLGRGVVKRLVASGKNVRAVARGPEKAELLRSIGAEPVSVDLFDRPALERALGGFEVVLHLATSIPPRAKMSSRAAWANNDRLRTEATRALVDASTAVGVRAVIAQSITLPYPDRGDAWIDEKVAFDKDLGWLGSVVDLEAEVARFGAGGGRGVSLRFGLFYGAQARSTEEYRSAARYRLAPVFGAPGAYHSSIHVDDAASAVVAALSAPSGAWNVVDDEPLTRAEFVEAFRAAFGLGWLAMAPPWLARMGGAGVEPLLRSQRVANGAFKSATGWKPALRSARDGWAR